MVRLYKEALKEALRTDFELQVLDGSCQFAEGPVWSPEGYYLFSDIPSNVIYKIVPGQPKSVYLEKSGCARPEDAEISWMMGSNGLALDPQQHLLICQHGNHRVAKYAGGAVEPLITEYEGRLLNSPNDIIADAKGRIFFSDPPYGLKDQQANPEKYQQKAGLYCWQEGVLTRFWDQLQFPNGVCLSPDQQFLYAGTSKAFEAGVLEFDAATLRLRRVVCRETGDGLKCDRHGNLYISNKEGVLVVNREGERLGVLSLPSEPANLCWGGKDGNDLFITARKNIFHIRDLQK
ncbi:SMP-30/gluconolactonase/LRE family protein [Paraflavisolibacter sp. H34]|uniref:SMP-30/gluconolactonase/LRE family protein n=1 Tax=Huijunlia imazamoxiresistens TaxID=3127457 RepID=UPI0030163062